MVGAPMHTKKCHTSNLENYVWIYAHVAYSDQCIVMWGIWFIWSCDY